MDKLDNRFDFIYIFDVQDGNPNGDPDAGNLPRVDSETGMGLVTDVCLKRKVRNYIQITCSGIVGKDILVKSKEFSGKEVFINEEISNAYKELGLKDKKEKEKDEKKGKDNIEVKSKTDDVGLVRNKMCEKFYDVRTFGAVLSTGANAGQVRGPIQLTFSRSCDPIIVSSHTLTVCAARDKDKPFESQIGIQGRKSTVPYGLYLCHGFVSANLAKQTGFTDDDLNLFWESLKNMFDHDRSAARGLMNARKLIVFKHDSVLGNAPANQLFDLVKVTNVSNIEPRSFEDYKIEINEKNIPQGVSLINMI